MRIGIQIQPQNTSFQEIRETAWAADAIGVDSIYIWDHAVPLSEGSNRTQEAWTTLAALAVTTKRCRIGTLVSPIGFRSPALLALMANTVDEISEGRLVLGLGSGWHKPDYEELEIGFDTAPIRAQMLHKSMVAIKARTPGIPILIGGGGEKQTLRTVAEFADSWHSFSDIEQYRHKSLVLEDYCVEVGRDPEEIERSVYASWGWTFLEADEFRKAGVNELVFSMKAPFEIGWAERWLRWRDE